MVPPSVVIVPPMSRSSVVPSSTRSVPPERVEMTRLEKWPFVVVIVSAPELAVASITPVLRNAPPESCSVSVAPAPSRMVPVLVKLCA